MVDKRIRSFSLILGIAATLAGCASQAKVPPAASPRTPTVVVGWSEEERAVSYPEGRYELRGQGSGASPYSWVWIPMGTIWPSLPSRRTQTR